LKDNDYIPNEVLCSTAHRCVETWQGLEHVMRLGIQPQYDKGIYQAHVGVLHKKLKAATADVVLMVGHNPGISGLAEELLEVVPGSQNFYNYPTAATTLIDFDINDWSKLKLRSGKLHSFIVPRELGM
jgi:phosphohistidine phosphatase